MQYNQKQQQQIQYELALDCISGLIGILTRINYWNEKKPHLSQSIINEIEKRRVELDNEWADRSLFESSDTKKIEEILDTYGTLNKKFNDLFENKFDKNIQTKITDNHCFFDDLITKRVNYEV